MIHDWLTPTVASLLMLTGVIPATINVRLLYAYRGKPGVTWFLYSMVLGGAWAVLFATFTLVRDPGVTLALANFFWVVPPAASVAMFLLAYEYVSSKPPSRMLVGVLSFPILVLFALSWTNPNNLVYTTAYHVDANGILQFPAFGGPLKVAVVKGYGYLLFTLAAGILIGEVVRTTGARRRETAFILLIFSTLGVSTLIKVANLVPIYFDPTTVVFSLSGLAFAFSTQRNGFLKMVRIAREQAFEQVEDAILIADPSGFIVDSNDQAKTLFGASMHGKQLSTVLHTDGPGTVEDDGSMSFDVDGERRHFSIRRSPVMHFRGTQGTVVVLTDITAVKNRELDLDLFKQVLTRIIRHNMRNDLTVIGGYADVIASKTTDPVETHAREIQKTTQGLVDKTTKAKAIEEIFTDEMTQKLSLRDVVEDAIASYRETNVAGTIQTSVTDHSVRGHPKLSLALQELIENAVTHGDCGEDPLVRIYSERDGETVTVFVEDTGTGIPETELRVLDAEAETNLQHGSGIGLWLVHWIVKHSNGEIVTGSSPHGSRVGLRVQIVE